MARRGAGRVVGFGWGKSGGLEEEELGVLVDWLERLESRV